MRDPLSWITPEKRTSPQLQENLVRRRKATLPFCVSLHNRITNLIQQPLWWRIRRVDEEQTVCDKTKAKALISG